jgi:hypothetical protein
MPKLYWAILNAVLLLLEVSIFTHSSQFKLEFYFIKYLVPYLTILFVKYNITDTMMY